MSLSITNGFNTQAYDVAGAVVARSHELLKQRLSQETLHRIDNIRQFPRVNAWVAEILERYKDPTLASNRESYEAVEGELFSDAGPSLADIGPGALGDCYFLAAVGSMVAHDPNAVREMIRQNADGTYDVRFYADVDGQRQAVTVTVDGDLPVDANGNLVYANAADSDGDGQLELWVPLLEKAYAKFKDEYGPDDEVRGYADVGGGGATHVAMQEITGRNAYSTSDYATDEELLALLNQVDDGKYVTVATRAAGTDPGWANSHAYVVVGTYQENGETMVILKNPWGRAEPDGADTMGGDDGLFAIPSSEVRENIRDVQVGEPKPVARYVEVAVVIDRVRELITPLSIRA